MIAKEDGFDENYVAHMSEKIQSAYPLTVGHQFITAMNHEAEQAIKIAIKQRKIIERFAA